jgi:flagellar capping protein FliD
MTEQVPVAELTEVQLARATYAAIKRIEMRMSELDAEVADLDRSVAAIAQRILPQLDALRDQLAAAQAGEAAALQDAAENVARIRTDVAALDALATDTPPPPVEESPGV